MGKLVGQRWLRMTWFSLLAFAGGAFANHLATAETQADSPYALIRQLARVLVLVENEYVDPVDRSRLLDGAISGMVTDLDPHSSYLPARSFSTFQADTKGEFGGVGVEVDFRNDQVTVIAPIEGSPAEKAGIRPGDKIVSIDKQAVRGKTISELVEKMRGPPGTTVQVSIRRKGHSGLLHFDLVRRVIEVASVGQKRLIDGIGYLRVKQFQRDTHYEFLEALSQLREADPTPLKGLILDLRNNPGGLVSEAVAITDELLDHGTIYSTRHREKIVDSVDASRGGAASREALVVLVNEYSASASELVSGALQDNGRATIVGAPTFGKGSVQSIFDLPGGAGLRLTTMRYYTPNGRAIQALGIKPDVLVEAAYVQDKSFGVVRESDLENHLPAENSADKRGRPKLSPDEVVEEETGLSPTYMGVARVVPKDPTGGPDFALSIGFQIVRGVLQQKQ